MLSLPCRQNFLASGCSFWQAHSKGKLDRIVGINMYAEIARTRRHLLRRNDQLVPGGHDLAIARHAFRPAQSSLQSLRSEVNANTDNSSSTTISVHFFHYTQIGIVKHNIGNDPIHIGVHDHVQYYIFPHCRAARHHRHCQPQGNQADGVTPAKW